MPVQEVTALKFHHKEPILVSDSLIVSPSNHLTTSKLQLSKYSRLIYMRPPLLLNEEILKPVDNEPVTEIPVNKAETPPLLSESCSRRSTGRSLLKRNPDLALDNPFAKVVEHNWKDKNQNNLKLTDSYQEMIVNNNNVSNLLFWRQ